jgi:hypothetical protein
MLSELKSTSQNDKELQLTRRVRDWGYGVGITQTGGTFIDYVGHGVYEGSSSSRLNQTGRK